MLISVTEFDADHLDKKQLTDLNRFVGGVPMRVESICPYEGGVNYVVIIDGGGEDRDGEDGPRGLPFVVDITVLDGLPEDQLIGPDRED